MFCPGLKSYNVLKCLFLAQFGSFYYYFLPDFSLYFLLSCNTYFVCFLSVATVFLEVIKKFVWLHMHWSVDYLASSESDLINKWETVINTMSTQNTDSGNEIHVKGIKNIQNPLISVHVVTPSIRFFSVLLWTCPSLSNTKLVQKWPDL